MTDKDRRLKQENDVWLEALRIERTKLTQDQLAFRCSIPRSTYQRWITRKSEIRLSISQLKLLCKEFGIERIDEIPDDLGTPDPPAGEETVIAEPQLDGLPDDLSSPELPVKESASIAEPLPEDA